MTAEETLKSIIEDGIELGAGDYIPFETLKATAKALKEYIEYKHLEEQGLLLRLPCKVGDTVYQIRNKRHAEGVGIAERRISCINIYSSNNYSLSHQGMTECYSRELNKTWFLTREEAEAKLKEMEGDGRMSEHKPIISLDDKDFGAVLNCAIRYCIGRQTYMPALVIDFITPLLPYVNKTTLLCFKRDLSDATYFGDEAIDKPIWMRFKANVEYEMGKRGLEDNA